MKQIVKKPIISEKSFAAAGIGKFSFIADKNSNKESLKKVIEDIYKVEVIKVNTQNVDGKLKRSKGKIGKRDDFKKIVVTLKKGQKIALFEAEKDPAKPAEKKKVEKKETKAVKKD